MTDPNPSHEQIAPRKAIRRFDVFAEVSRLEALSDGRPEDEAKGHGIWLAKVVAARRFGATGDRDGDRARPRDLGRSERRATPDFRAVGGELQTDETFEEEIIERMGRAFYERVFAPAIRATVEAGGKYEDFRDAVRAEWKPRR